MPSKQKVGLSAAEVAFRERFRVDSDDVRFSKLKSGCGTDREICDAVNAETRPEYTAE